MATVAPRRPLYRHLYVQVLIGIALGIVLGNFWPKTGVAMRPLGDGFIKLIRMMIAPIIFGTVVSGIAKMGDMKSVGRIGIRALLYFEAVSTIALLIGLVVVNVLKPGVGVHANPAALDATAVSSYATQGAHLSAVDFVLNIIPTTIVGAFAQGDILPVLFFSVLFGLALLQFGEHGHALLRVIDQFTHTMFGMVGLIMRAAPIGAFGAMAFTIGQFGIRTLFQLGKLMGGFYLTCVIFLVVVLAPIARWAGFSLWKFLRHIREEFLIVIGTSSSESVLPRLMAKLERMGCSEAVVGLVVPTGYSFNLDGTSIYMTMAAVFIAQATDTPLGIPQQLGILAVLLLTSKGAAAMTGGGFITLAATLSAMPTIPVAGLALIVGIDRFMSEARAILNMIGNGVGTIVIAKWDGSLDVKRLNRVLDGLAPEEEDEAPEVLVAEAAR
jgi:aerobic C4-dicarboxylate transport protein